MKSPITSFLVIPANPGSGPGQAPESRFFEHLQNVWTPVTLSRRKPGTGVTTFCEAVKIKHPVEPVDPVGKDLEFDRIYRIFRIIVLQK